MKKQRIIMFEGADITGKTNIAQFLGEDMGISYFKNQREVEGWKADTYNFKTALEYECPFILSMFQQTDISMIIDRHYPTEYVYSTVYNRDTDTELIWKLDEAYSKLNTFIIYCYKYGDKYLDDFKIEEDLINVDKIESIKKTYQDFIEKTKCRVIKLDTTNCDLEKQINTIKHWIEFLEEGHAGI